MVIFSLSPLGFLNVFATGGHSLTDATAELGLTVPAAIAMVLLVWPTVDNNLYSTSLGTSNIFEIPKTVGVRGRCARHRHREPESAHDDPSMAESTRRVHPAVAAPPLVEYYLLGNRISDQNLDDSTFKVNWPAFIAWAVAYAIPTMNISPLVGIVMGCIAYLVVFTVSKETAAYPLNGLEPTASPVDD